MPANSYSWLDDALATIHRADWYRSVQTIQGRSGAVVQLEGQSVINFASNDYLGLAGDDRLIQAAIAATQEYGTSSTGSRLVSGHRELHRQLEQAIAAFKQTDDALVFSSGYLANLGTVSALASKRDLVLADQYNHASLKNGAVLSGATVLEYTHGDMQHLQQQLKQRDRFRRCLILTDSVFSMDGDLCPLPELLRLADAFDCMLLVDEAHATGVLGATGAGVVEHFGCTGRAIVQVGTLSKALGSLGGYVAGSATLIDFLRNRAAGWIYTTGLSPADTGAALAAVAIVQQEPQHRVHLWQNVADLKHALTQHTTNSLIGAAIKLLPSESPILCLQVDRPITALHLAKSLRQSGIFAPAIRPPTVPTSRLRLTLMATHHAIHLQQFVSALDNATLDLNL